MIQTSILHQIKGIPQPSEGWSESMAVNRAAAQGLELTPEHWDVIYFLRRTHARHGDALSGREMGRIVAERFRLDGGRRFLYRLFPRGPVAQGCELAGIDLPHGTLDRSFGTVQ